MTITDVIGKIPYRMAFAGGWIDQPFVSRLNPEPARLDGGGGAGADLPLHGPLRHGHRHPQGGHAAVERPPARRATRPQLVRELYAAENQGKAEPSGSQDMIGLIYPGVNRLDYDFCLRRRALPRAHRIEQRSARRALAGRGDPHGAGGAAPEGIIRWAIKNLDPEWIRRLGPIGQGLLRRHPRPWMRSGLGASMNECMQCWEAILPHTVRHPDHHVDLMAILGYYQSRYAGAMYSGCGGGYLFVVSESRCPGVCAGQRQDMHEDVA